MTRHPHAPAAELGDVESLGDGGRAVADDALAPLPTDAWITGTPEVLPGSPTTVGAGRVRLSDGWREYRRKAVRDHAPPSWRGARRTRAEGAGGPFVYTRVRGALEPYTLSVYAERRTSRSRQPARIRR